MELQTRLGTVAVAARAVRIAEHRGQRSMRPLGDHLVSAELAVAHRADEPHETQGRGNHATGGGLSEHVLRAKWHVSRSVPEGLFELRLSLDRAPSDLIVVPAALYEDGRSSWVPGTYPPYQTDAQAAEARRTGDRFVADIPRLSPNGSRLNLIAGDMTLHAVGIHRRGAGAMWFVFQGFTRFGETGLSLAGSEHTLEIVLRYPGVRLPHRYSICSTFTRSTDRGPALAAGTVAGADIRLLEPHPRQADAGEPARLFDVVPSLWRSAGPRAALAPDCSPLSRAFEIIERKFNAQSWDDEHGFYHEGVDAGWKTGWTGGPLSLGAFLRRGGDLSKRRAVRALRFLLGDAQNVPVQSELGLYRDVFRDGRWLPHGFWGSETSSRHLLRRTTEVLFLATEQIPLAAAGGHASETDTAAWWASLRRAADGLVRVYELNGHLPQLVDIDTGTTIVPGTASAGLAPAALVRAAGSFNEERYASAAVAIADDFWNRCSRHGIADGGPGDIMQAPDSESAYALVEGYLAVYEYTGERRFLDYAIAAMHQFATWVMAYDYPFPPDTTFGHMGMTTRGTVFANVQNKHSAPGICTHSGRALLRLYEHTDDSFALELLASIARSLPQFVSTTDRPIASERGIQHPGWVSERVETSDWLQPVGEVAHGSFWSEIAVLLTAAELPSVYVDRGHGRVWSLDAVEAAIRPDGTIELRNPTTHPGRYRVAERGTAEQQWETLPIAAGNVITIAS